VIGRKIKHEGTKTRSPAGWTAQIGVLAGIAFLFFVGGCGARTSAGDQALIEQAEALHRSLTPGIADDARLRGYMQQIGARLLAAAKDVMREQFSSKAVEESDWKYSRDIQFHVAKSGIPNAFATGGHHVYVLLPALQKCQSEDELAAALVHAYSHTLLRHIEHNVPSEGPDAAPASIVQRFVEHRFSLKQEQEADELAFKVHARAGWDPVAFVSMLEHLETDRTRVGMIQARLEKLPPAAQEWSRPPIADVKRFEEHKAGATANAVQKRPPTVVERLLAAMPNCFQPEDTPAQREAQRELMTPAPTDTPNTFEKGQRR
jgi:Zn-dependent protease with chaperone function